MSQVDNASSHAEAPAFHRWMPAFYKDSAAPANVWAQKAAVDANAGSRRCMNHICRPQTCHKGRWAKIKFCRMFFWHWAQRAHKKTGQPVMARLHGHTLHQRWVAGDWPPVQQVPPQAGMPSLERNHAFHCKMSPGVFLSARCNHDLSILLRLPVLSERMKSVMAHFANSLRDEQEEDDKQEAQRFYEESVDVMVQLIVDHEYTHQIIPPSLSRMRQICFRCCTTV